MREHANARPSIVLPLSPDQKVAGALVPVFALRGERDLGIGDTEAVKEFAFWAADHGLRAIQILPVNETGADHSPYNVISSMAVEPGTITTYPDILTDLTASDFSKISRTYDLKALRAGRVNYDTVKELKTKLLRAAFARFQKRAPAQRTGAFAAFRQEHAAWLDAYQIYRALVEVNGTELTPQWPAEHQSPPAVQDWIEDLDEHAYAEFQNEVDFRAYIQWIGFSQWHDVLDTCHSLDIALIGDIPVGVSLYSADVWLQPGIFDLSRSSGAPPEHVFATDPFTAKWGQNWGFPLYDWRAMSHDNFAWWRRRLRLMKGMFDLIRVDHALGFFRIYSFPWRPQENAEYLELTEEEAAAKTGGPLPCFVPQDDTSEENRERNRRHGETLFRLFLEEAGPDCLIAEDLGEVAPYVRPTLEQLEIPGFKIPQWERADDDSWTPGDEYPRLSLATYATHDHPPVRAFWNDWLNTIDNGTPDEAEGALREMRKMMAFAGEPELTLPRKFDHKVHQAILNGLLNCNSWLVIPMITDILALEDRFNVPGAADDQNWSVRLAVPISKIDETFSDPLKRFATAIHASGRA